MITFTITNRDRPKATVKLLASFCGHKYRMCIGVGVDPKYWDDKNHRAKSVKDYDGSDVNEAIRRFGDAAAEYLRSCARDRIIPSADDFRDAVTRAASCHSRPEREKEAHFLSPYMENVYIPRYERTRDGETLKKYVTALNKLKDYESVYGQVSFDDVDIAWYNRFQGWFYLPRGEDGKVFSANYFGSIIKVIKQCYNEARDVDRLHSGTGTEHRDFRTVNEQGAAVYLTLDELRKIEGCDLSEERLMKEYKDQRHQNRERNAESMQRARSLFLIACFTGLRVSDFSRLDLSNFDNNRIRIRTHKTRSDIVIPVHPVIRRILESGFSFEGHLSEQKMNKHIKDICRLSGITDTVTVYRTEGLKQKAIRKPKYEMVCNHTARRSFATNATKSGVPAVMVMKILGMTRESTLMRYIRQTAEENADMMAEMDFFQ